jgi:hypothetical protein
MALEKINEEAHWKSELRIDIDKHRYTYQTSEYNAEDDETVIINFVSPSLFVYEHYRFYLLKNSVIKPLNVEYYFRPDYLSYEEYGATVLWTMILYINDIPNIESFVDIKELYIPNMSAIYRIADNQLTNHPINIQQKPIQLPAISKAKMYTKKSVPTMVIQPADVKVDRSSRFYFMRQIFVIAPIDLVNQYIDIKYESVPQSINFRIKGKSEFVYGHDYILKRDNDGKYRRISWNMSDVSGDGLLDVMDIDMRLEIQYARK